MAGAPSTLVRKIPFRAFSGVAHPLQALRSDKGECIYIKESRLRDTRKREKGGGKGEKG